MSFRSNIVYDIKVYFVEPLTSKKLFHSEFDEFQFYYFTIDQKSEIGTQSFNDVTMYAFVGKSGLIDSQIPDRLRDGFPPHQPGYG